MVDETNLPKNRQINWHTVLIYKASKICTHRYIIMYNGELAYLK